jgi:4-hydroxyproline epimerase
VRLRVVDSHTEGEPTRVLVGGGPVLDGTPDKKRTQLEQDHDWIRRACCREPRGHEAIVGAWIGPPNVPDCHLDVVFFNNVGYLGMCGHGTIGVVETLRHLGQLPGPEVRLNTPVGVVEAQAHDDGSVSFQNVVSFRQTKDVVVVVPGWGPVRGDVAFGGNGFFLVQETVTGLDTGSTEAMLTFTRAVLTACREAGMGGPGWKVDHIEVALPALRPDADARNFVLCPGGEYDRSPCGTGTSAKLACLAADGRLAPGQEFKMEGWCGGLFVGHYRSVEGGIAPTVRGRAWVTAETELLMLADDPFRFGL